MLWCAETLRGIAKPSEAVDLRGFFATAGRWPEVLPSCGGDCLVVSGLEGILDTLEEADLVTWIERDLRPAILGFQEEYEGQAGLVMWLPSGAKRMEMDGATEQYYWKPHSRPRLPLGQYLWGGAEADVERILIGEDPEADSDGPAWCGLYHPRIS